MLKDKTLSALNKQLNEELASAYLYYSMSAYFESLNLRGFANWMRVQALEELTHAQKFYDHIVGRGGRVIMDSLKKPDTEWNSPTEAFAAALEHERFITASIDKLVTAALEERDYATKTFLDWFVTEQVEEEAQADEVLQKVKMVEKSIGAMFVLDRDLGKRTFSNAANGGE
ncbi:MAG: ferritin [Myxococcota bacterium]